MRCLKLIGIEWICLTLGSCFLFWRLCIVHGALSRC